METQSKMIEITKTKNSRINEVDFDNLSFGKVCSDHMMICDYKDGKWGTPQVLPYGPMPMEPSSKVFHYGQAVFEGMKAFKDEDGKVWLFRPEQNFNRINISAKRLAIPEFPKEYFFEALETILKLDKDTIIYPGHDYGSSSTISIFKCGCSVRKSFKNLSPPTDVWEVFF